MIPVLHGVWAAAGGLVSDFEHIETQTVGAGGALTVTFNAIPGTYKHLQIRIVSRTDASAVESWQSMKFNGSTSGYANHILYGNGTNALSTSELLGNRINFGTTAGNTAGASTFGACVIDILDYASTTKNKTCRYLDGYDNNGAGVVALRSGLWANTAAISSIEFGPQNFGTVKYVQHTTFALYGVK